MGRTFLTPHLQADLAQDRERFVGMTEPDRRLKAVLHAPMASDSGGNSGD